MLWLISFVGIQLGAALYQNSDCRGISSWLTESAVGSQPFRPMHPFTDVLSHGSKLENVGPPLWSVTHIILYRHMWWFNPHGFGAPVRMNCNYLSDPSSKIFNLPIHWFLTYCLPNRWHFHQPQLYFFFCTKSVNVILKGCTGSISGCILLLGPT